MTGRNVTFSTENPLKGLIGHRDAQIESTERR